MLYRREHEHLLRNSFQRWGPDHRTEGQVGAKSERYWGLKTAVINKIESRIFGLSKSRRWRKMENKKKEIEDGVSSCRVCKGAVWGRDLRLKVDESGERESVGRNFFSWGVLCLLGLLRVLWVQGLWGFCMFFTNETTKLTQTKNISSS